MARLVTPHACQQTCLPCSLQFASVQVGSAAKFVWIVASDCMLVRDAAPDFFAMDGLAGVTQWAAWASHCQPVRLCARLQSVRSVLQ
jgi:hypothetical protein